MRAPAPLPRELSAYIWQHSALHQAVLALLAIVVFVLSALPLEIQRRLIDDALRGGAIAPILWLAGAYAAVVLSEGSLKMAMNLYRAWVSETAVRDLRRTIAAQINRRNDTPHDATVDGLEISMILSEAEPVGGFIGLSVSEPLLQGGILLSVFGYMVYLQPEMAALCFLVYSPQLLFVPLMQGGINRRAAERIQTLRLVSGGIAATGVLTKGDSELQNERIDRVFVLNMGIYKLKFTMNLLMNAMYHFGITATLAVGGWYVVAGKLEVGTVVAFLSGLAKINDPWGDVVNWFREMTTSRVKYDLLATASRWLAATHLSQNRPEYSAVDGEASAHAAPSAIEISETAPSDQAAPERRADNRGNQPGVRAAYR